MVFDPIATLPKDLNATRTRRCRKLAPLAAHQYRAAVELKCLECCAWERVEVKRCQITACPLWALRARIFEEAAS